MPAQRTGDVAAVANVLAASGQLRDSVRTMLLEGLPHAATEGCGHPYQKEFLVLAGGALEGTKQIVTEELASVEAELKTAEEKVEAIKSAEAGAATVHEEAVEGVADTEASAASAAAAVQEAESEHEQVEGKSTTFLQHRQEKQQERVRADAVIQGPLRLLQDSGWDDDETKLGAVEAVEGLLGELCTDKVLLAAAPIALGTKPDGRAGFDIAAVDAVTKALSEHLFAIDSKLAETEVEEVNKRSELLGLWAIADCARDVCADADVALASARRKQKSAQAELIVERSRAKAQEEEVAERAAKRARVMTQLMEVDESMAALARLAAGRTDAEATTELAAESVA